MNRWGVLPDYVDFPGEPVVVPPIALHGAALTVFVLSADKAALATLCRRFFDTPTRRAVHVEPMGPFVLLVAARVDRAFSLEPRDRERGTVPEIDVGFWVPVMREHAGERSAAWFLPYVFVDSAFAMASGREIYGFPKVLGAFSLPDEPSVDAPITVDTMVLDPKGSSARTARLVTVEPAPGGSSLASAVGLGGLLGGLALKVVRELEGGADLALHFRDQMTDGRVPFLFLKQMRDVADGRRACFQSVVEANARAHTVRGAGAFSAPHRVIVNSYESHPVSRDLGLAPTSYALASLWVDLDFEMEAGRTLWTHGTRKFRVL